MSVDADLALLQAAAAEAARLAGTFFRRDPEVWWKEGNSPVSEADLAVDRFLRDALIGARPDYGWVSEETAGVAPADPERGRFFLVDPIDGTRSFLRGEDTWCVALAVIENGRPVAGVIDAPMKGAVFAARAGAGATLNGERLAPTPVPEGEPLRVAVPDGLQRRLKRAGADAMIAAMASAPSLAYRIAEVASGALHGTLVRPNANDWDIAAGDLILAESGGRLGNASGEERLYNTEPRRHGLLVAAAHGAWPRLQAVARLTETA